MSYTPVPTKSAGDTLTETNWNTHIRDNFAAGVPDVFTTKGDLAVATAADTASRLGVGNDDSTLVADAGEATGLAWQIQPAARVYNSGNIAIALSSWVSLTFDSERFDTDGMHSTSSNTERLTVPAGGAGLYLIGVHVTWDTSPYSGGSAEKGIRFMLNGAMVIAQKFWEDVHQSIDLVDSLQTFYSLAVGDYVVAQVYTSNAANVQAVSNYSPEAWAIWTRRA